MRAPDATDATVLQLPVGAPTALDTTLRQVPMWASFALHADVLQPWGSSHKVLSSESDQREVHRDGHSQFRSCKRRERSRSAKLSVCGVGAHWGGGKKSKVLTAPRQDRKRMQLRSGRVSANPSPHKMCSTLYCRDEALTLAPRQGALRAAGLPHAQTAASKRRPPKAHTSISNYTTSMLTCMHRPR